MRHIAPYHNLTLIVYKVTLITVVLCSIYTFKSRLPNSLIFNHTILQICRRNETSFYIVLQAIMVPIKLPTCHLDPPPSIWEASRKNLTVNSFPILIAPTLLSPSPSQLQSFHETKYNIIFWNLVQYMWSLRTTYNESTFNVLNLKSNQFHN